MILMASCGNAQDKQNKELEKNLETLTSKMAFISDKSCKLKFNVEEVANTENSSGTCKGYDEGIYFVDSEKLQEIFSEVTDIPKSRITVSDKLSNKFYCVSYKNSGVTSSSETRTDLKSKLIQNFGLNEVVTKKNIDIYHIKLKDIKKLKKAKDTTFAASGFGTHGDEIVTDVNSNGGNIKEFSKVITKHLKITTEDHTGIDDKQKFDFEIEAKNIQELEVALKKYGLYLEKTTKEVEFYSYE